VKGWVAILRTVKLSVLHQAIGRVKRALTRPQ
jgi:hypothetical protein